MQEMVLVGLLFLVIFGPSKLPDMARDVGRFVNVARRSMEEFKKDLVSEEDEGRELRNDPGQKASRELEELVGREGDVALARSAERTEQRQQ
jgi:sec-independent protein translocase protein TatB